MYLKICAKISKCADRKKWWWHKVRDPYMQVGGIDLEVHNESIAAHVALLGQAV